MATPIWNPQESRWVLRLQKDGATRKFTSVKPGPSGKREVLRRAREWEGKEKKPTTTVSDAWKLYLHDTDKRCAKSTALNIRKYGEYYIIPQVGKMKLSLVNHGRWQDVINNAKPTGRTLLSGKKIYQTEDLSRKTYSNIRGTIVTFCRFCVRSGYEATIPEGLYLPYESETIGKEVLTPEQIISVFASGDWFANSWKLMLLTGLRPGECYAIRKSDIDGRVLRINRAIDPQRNITKGKSKNARRMIYLPALALDLLSDQYRKIETLHTDIVFPNLNGEIPHPSWTYRQWKRFGAQNDITAPLYSLRHTHATNMVDSLSLAALKAEMGHSEAMDTIGVYVKSTDDSKSKTADIVDITFRSILKKTE